MGIGNLLRMERKALDLTQEQMAANVMSVAQYSRIEKNKQEIKVTDLFDILLAHDINIETFFEKVFYFYQTKDNPISEDRLLLSNEIDRVFYEHDIVKAKKIKKEFAQFNNSDNLYLRATIVLALLEDKISELDDTIQDHIRKYFIKSDNWTENKITLLLFASGMNFFSFDVATLLMEELINKYHAIDDFPLKNQEYVATICCSYLNLCFEHNNNNNNDLVKESLNLLNNLPAMPELFMFKMLGSYYEAKFNNDLTLVQEIKNVMRKSGYAQFTKHFL